MFLDIHSCSGTFHTSDHGSFPGCRNSGREKRHFGCAGLSSPVFAGFSGGIGVFLQSSGGYLAGFLLSALLMWGMEKLLGRSTVILGISMVLGLLVCYAAGTIWFMAVYTANTGAVGVGTVLAWCVIPFILPDLVKIAVALVLTKRLAGVVRR